MGRLDKLVREIAESGISVTAVSDDNGSYEVYYVFGISNPGGHDWTLHGPVSYLQEWWEGEQIRQAEKNTDDIYYTDDGDPRGFFSMPNGIEGSDALNDIRFIDKGGNMSELQTLVREIAESGISVTAVPDDRCKTAYLFTMFFEGGHEWSMIGPVSALEGWWAKQTDEPTDAQRLAELEEAMANLLAEMKVLRGKEPLKRPRLLVRPVDREVAEQLLDIGIIQGIHSSLAVLREQVRELTGEVEKLRRVFIDPSGLVLQDNVTTTE